MDPRTLEAILFLKENRTFWDVQTVNDLLVENESNQDIEDTDDEEIIDSEEFQESVDEEFEEEKED